MERMMKVRKQKVASKTAMSKRSARSGLKAMPLKSKGFVRRLEAKNKQMGFRIWDLKSEVSMLQDDLEYIKSGTRPNGT